MNWLVLNVIAFGVAAFVIQMRYFVYDNRPPDPNNQNEKVKIGWHLAGGILHVWCGITISLLPGASFVFGLLFASLTWLFFDGFVNTFVFKKGWYYIGNTAALDRTIRWLCRRRNVYWVNPEAAAGILKILFVVGSIIWLIVKIKA